MDTDQESVNLNKVLLVLDHTHPLFNGVLKLFKGRGGQKYRNSNIIRFSLSIGLETVLP
jgi:hypothetical protein